jgi:hypothetical protein
MISYIDRLYKSLFVMKDYVTTELTTIRIIGNIGNIENNNKYSLSIINDGPKLLYDYDMSIIYDIV